MKENYYSLMLCIFNDKFSVDSALGYFETGNTTKVRRRDISPEDIADMIKMKETMTYQQIGDIYGMDKHAIFGRIKRYMKAI